jgi:hypothetical protein
MFIIPPKIFAFGGGRAMLGLSCDYWKSERDISVAMMYLFTIWWCFHNTGFADGGED